MLKIAVPSRGDMVDEHFGHCEAFMVFTIGQNRNILDQMRLTPPPACGCKSDLVVTLVDMGVTVLLAGGMGEGAVQLLASKGVAVVRGASGPAREAVQAWLDQRLVDNDEVCHAHGAEGCGAH